MAFKFTDSQNGRTKIMFKISKRFDFCASHQLKGLPEEHQCSRLHGHNYSVTVHLKARDINEIGFVRDYGELDEVKELIDKKLEHRHLNEVLGFNPTAENIAWWLYKVTKDMFSEVYAVSVKETDKTEAIYEEPDGEDELHEFD
jgi:6-pyruvoyltetrahydropterin/6-carboxytetrahydropterin synthase